MVKNQRGQTFIEFVLLMAILVGMAFTVLKGFNGAIASRWQAIIKVVANPSPSTIELE